MNAQEMKEMADSIAKSLGSMPNHSQDSQIQNIIQFFEIVVINENPMNAKSMASAALTEALVVTEQFLERSQRKFTSTQSNNNLSPKQV